MDTTHPYPSEEGSRLIVNFFVIILKLLPAKIFYNKKASNWRLFHEREIEKKVFLNYKAGFRRYFLI
jgi:hypothetical protein